MHRDALLARNDRLRRYQPGGAQWLDAAELGNILDRISRPEPIPSRLAARRGESSWFVDPRQITLLRESDKYVAFRHEGKEHVLER